MSVSEGGVSQSFPRQRFLTLTKTGVGNRQIHSDLIEIYNIPCADVDTSMYRKLLNFVKDYPRKQRVAITGRLPVLHWLWHFLYIFDPVSCLHIYTFVVSRAFMAGAASQAGDTDSSRAPGLTSGLQGSVNVHRGALLLVPQWQCISSLVFYIHFINITYAFKNR